MGKGKGNGEGEGETGIFENEKRGEREHIETLHSSVSS